MAPRNQFPFRGSLTSAVEFFAITPADDADVEQVPRAIYVGGGGDLTVIAQGGGDPVTFKAVPGGQTLVISPARVLDTGTTATDLVGLV